MSAQARPHRRFERTPAGWVALWLTALGILALAALLLSLGAASGSSFSAEMHGRLLTAGAALLLLVPFFTLDRLQAQRRVWLGRQAPRGVWLMLLADHRRDLWVSWALIALPLMAWRGLGGPAAEVWPQTALAVALTAAVLAGVLGAALVTAAGLSSILDARWAALGAIGLAAVLVGGPGLPARAAVWAEGTGEAAALAAAWLMFAGALPLMALRHIEARLAVWRIAPGHEPQSWWARLAALGSRWSERWRLLDGAAKAAAPWGVIAQLPLNLTNGNPETRFLQPWDSTVSAGHGLRLVCMVLLAMISLRCLDMHWRVHLLPGGAARRWLGLRIIGSTIVTIVVPVATVFVAVGMALGLFFPRLVTAAWSSLPELIASYAAPILVDFCLAVAVAAWLRGRLGEFGPRGWTLSWLVIAAVGAVAVLGHVQAWPPLWTRGVWHHTIELALAAVFALLANRAWQGVDLGHLMRRSTDDRRKP